MTPPAARPRRCTTGADISRANATPKSDIDSRIPTAKTTISTSSVATDAVSTRCPNGASIVSARRLLTAKAAPTMVGRCEWAEGSGCCARRPTCRWKWA